MADEHGARVDRTGSQQPTTVLQTYNRNGHKKRTCDDGTGDGERKTAKKGSITIEPDGSDEGTGEFTVEATGTGSGSRRERPLKDLHSPVCDPEDLQQANRGRQDKRGVKSRREGHSNEQDKLFAMKGGSTGPTQPTKGASKEVCVILPAVERGFPSGMSTPLRRLGDARPGVDVVTLSSPSGEELSVLEHTIRTEEGRGGSRSKTKTNLEGRMQGHEKNLFSATEEVDGCVGEVHRSTCSTAAKTLCTHDRDAGQRKKRAADMQSASKVGGEKMVVAVQHGSADRNTNVYTRAFGSVVSGVVVEHEVQTSGGGGVCKTTRETPSLSPQQPPEQSFMQRAAEKAGLNVSITKRMAAGTKVPKATITTAPTSGTITPESDFTFQLPPMEPELRIRSTVAFGSEVHACTMQGCMEALGTSRMAPTRHASLQRSGAVVVHALKAPGTQKKSQPLPSDLPALAIRGDVEHEGSWVEANFTCTATTAAPLAKLGNLDVSTSEAAVLKKKAPSQLLSPPGSMHEQKSGDEVVREQLQGMLDRLPPKERKEWLLEATKNVLTTKPGSLSNFHKSKSKDDKPRKEKFKLKSRKIHGQTRRMDRREREREDGESPGQQAGTEDAILKEIQAQKAARKMKESEDAARKKKAAEDAARKRKEAEEKERKENEEEEERRKVVDEFDRRIRELELQRSKLLFRKSPTGVSTFPPSAQESFRGHAALKSALIEFDQSNVKQVSNLSKKKVKSTLLAVSSDHSRSTTCADPLMLGVWESPKDVPPVELNASCQPTGRYWEHLSNYAFKRASMTFPSWDVPWPKQNRVRKTLFIERLKELYPGGWDSYWVLCKVGGNIRQRRVRMRNNFRKFNRKENAPLPPGLALGSWNEIYDPLSNPKYQELSDKCKVAAEERSKRKSFSHKLGPKGVAGLLQKFNDEFERDPTDTEIEFGKFHGVHSLIEYVHGRWKPRQEITASAEEPLNRSVRDGRVEVGKKVLKLAMQKSKGKRPVREDSESSADTTSSEDSGGENMKAKSRGGTSSDEDSGKGRESESDREDEDGENEGQEVDSDSVEDAEDEDHRACSE